MCSQPASLERADRGGDRERAERRRGAALVACRAGRPFDAVGGDVAHRAATREVRPAGVEPVRAPGENARAVRGVDLVAGEGDVVDVPGGDVERAVRRQLRGVERDPRAVAVREPGDLLDRPHLARHVGGARHRDERGASAERAQLRLQRVERLRGARRDRQVAHVAAPPRQQVRVVLARERQHRRAWRQRARQQVEGVGRVAREQHEIVVARADERVHDLARPRVRLGAHERGEARPAVHAAVVGQQLRDGVGDLPQRRRRSPRCRGWRSGPARRRRAGPADHRRQARAACRRCGTALRRW